MERPEQMRLKRLAQLTPMEDVLPEAFISRMENCA